jgi:phospholipid transport system substrate-binding protein
MAHASLGDHWNDLNGEQRAAYTRLYTSFIEDAYLNQIQDYSGQRIDVVRQDLNDSVADVYSTIVNPGDEPIDLDFRFELKNGTWKIYDVAIDDISMTSNYRTQFDRVIREQGFDSLMSSLHAKQMKLAASLGAGETDSNAGKTVAETVPPK